MCKISYYELRSVQEILRVQIPLFLLPVDRIWSSGISQKKAIAIPHSKWNSKIFKNCEISKDMLYEVSCPFSKYSVKIQNELLTVFQFKIWLLRHARAFNSIYRRNYWRKSGFVTSTFPQPYYGSITISRCITFKLKWQLVICINVQMLVYGTKNGIGEISLISDRISTF